MLKYLARYPAKEQEGFRHIPKRLAFFKFYNTFHLVNDDFLSKLKPNCIIINTSRGEVIDTNALIRMLEQRKILDAVLDVFENEKPETFSETEKAVYNRLYAMENVVLTPHVAGWTHESKRLLAQILLDRITEWDFRLPEKVV